MTLLRSTAALYVPSTALVILLDILTIGVTDRRVRRRLGPGRRLHVRRRSASSRSAAAASSTGRSSELLDGTRVRTKSWHRGDQAIFI